jgi:spermidine/putrescine transport system ATP-binding protein
MSEYAVELIELEKNFGEQEAVKRISLAVKQGEFLTLLGPSGCGKTTTLRMIAGFEKPTAGRIFLDGISVEDTEPYERNVNTVFQNYALFPHMNVFDNIAFGLVMKKVPKELIKAKVNEAISLVQLNGYAQRRPDQLSGGQKQRVAIARAIVNSPKVLLLDEPLGALDLKLRKQMQVELKRLQKKLGITFIYVTHDQEEALTMSNRIVVMNNGVIEQIGNPDEIYEKPKSRFVADFIGETNIFNARVAAVENGYAQLETEYGPITVVNDGFTVDDKVYMTIRPERLKVTSSPDDQHFSIKGLFKERIYVGSEFKLIVVLKSGQEVTINEPVGKSSYSQFSPDQEVFITWEINHAVVVKDSQALGKNSYLAAITESINSSELMTMPTSNKMKVMNDEAIGNKQTKPA